MTENEAKEMLAKHYEFLRESWKPYPDGKVLDAIRVAISSIDKNQQYRAIGTVEECREAMERQRGKVPNIWGDGYDDEGNMIYDMYDCPNCGKSYEVDYDDYKFCPNCGQAIERSDLGKLI